MSFTLPPCPCNSPLKSPLACIIAPVLLFPLCHPRFSREEHWKSEGRAWGFFAERLVYRASKRENKETDRSVRCVCLIVPVVAFPPLLFPVEACHHGLTGLFYHSHMALPFLSTSAPALFSLLFLYLSQSLLRCVCVSALYVWRSCLKIRRWTLKSITKKKSMSWRQNKHCFMGNISSMWANTFPFNLVIFLDSNPFCTAGYDPAGIIW